MKNLFLKGLLFSLALFISANVVCADVTVTDDIPKKINVQGKITTDSGQPMSGSKDITLTITDKDSHSFSKTVSVTLDSDGLYNADFDFTGKNINFNGPCSFAVQANGVTSVSRDISSVPTAFYSSSSTYSLVLDPVNGMKLVDGNFSPTNTYTIKVATANYAKKMSTNSDNGYVWGMTSNTEQGWISPGSLGIATASISTLGGIKLANSNTGLSSDISSDSILKVQLDTNAGLKIDNSNKITIDPATDAKFGVVKVTNGNGLSIGTGADKGKIKMALAGSTPGTMKLYDNVTGTNEDGTATQKAIKSAIDAISYTASNGVEIDNKVIKAVIDSSNANGLSVTAAGIKMALAGSTPGTMKLYDNVTGINEDGTATQKAIKEALGNKLSSNSSDYIKGLSINGKVITYTKGDNTTDTITTQDTTYSQATGSALGLVKLYNNVTGTNEDGTATQKAIKEALGNKLSSNSSDYIKGLSINGKVITYTKGDNTTDTITTQDTTYSQATGSALGLVKLYNNVTGTNEDGTATQKAIKEALGNKQNKLEGDLSGEPTKVWGKNGSSQGWVSMSDLQSAINADLAEIYRSKESLQPGDVVSIDTTRDDAIVKTKVAEDTLVAGVISTDPGLLLNSAEKGYKLALVGKVPTKVCNEGGEIKRGDLLVSASIAGYAKKAGDNPKAGTVIGKALENFSSKRGTILVLVNLQ